MSKYILIALFSGLISSFSQILLKKSAQKKKKLFIKEYLNWQVIVAYGITFSCMLLMIVAYRGMPYKYGPVLEALTYIYIMVFSGLFLGEKVTKKKLVGNLLIVVGVIVFSMGK